MDFDIDKLKEFSNIELLAKQLVEGFITGLHKSPYHGFSVEFAEHRLYNYGESTRHIDWKVFAKTDRLYTKRYEEETNLRCFLVLDNSSSMYYPQPGYGTFSDEIEVQTEVKSTATHVHKILLELQKIFEGEKTSKKTNVPSVLHQIAKKIHKRSLVIIFSDMFQKTENQNEMFSALQHLKHNKHTEIKKSYQTKMQAYYKELKLKCSQLKIDFVDADIHDDFDKILSAYLIKRTKMR